MNDLTQWVRIESGALVGTLEEGGLRAFRGIPYAAAPVGVRRWQPPHPVESWAVQRPAGRFGPRCVQANRAPNSVNYFGSEPQSEDCLYLNVWTGARDASDGLPVLVWLHGGAFELGSGALPLFDGVGLAQQGIIVVTVNYRLGRLGFLAHPALSAESAAGSSGNYGLMDQISALQWVQTNIRAFGGNPQAVTLAGQSVGAMSANALMTAPRARGLFHRVALHSGATMGPVGQTAGTGDAMQDLDAAERSGAAFAAALGAESADDLRALPAWQLQVARLDGSTSPTPAPRHPGNFDTSWMIVDGELLPSSVAETFRAGRQLAIPMLTGSTKDDWSVMPPLWADTPDGFATQARTAFADRYDQFTRSFPMDDHRSSAERVGRQIVGYRNFIWQNFAAAHAHAKSGRSAWHYRFEHAPPIPLDRHYVENEATELGAFHASELYYLFGTMSSRSWAWTEDDRALSLLMMQYWVRFVYSGDPNGSGDPSWPRFSASDPMTMRLSPFPRSEPTPELDRLQFFDADFAARERADARPASLPAADTVEC
jgi:para-nitrobenzyl esterase